MQIVIEISDRQYELLQRVAKTKRSMENLSEYGELILNGTPLPKGHGRLIDADVLKPDRCGEWNGLYVTEDTYKQSTIDNAPTIIEADKE